MGELIKEINAAVSQQYIEALQRLLLSMEISQISSEFCPCSRSHIAAMHIHNSLVTIVNFDTGNKAKTLTDTTDSN